MYYSSNDMDAIQLLALWGREHLRQHPDDDELADIQAELRRLRNGHKADSLISGDALTGFEARIMGALERLKSDLTLNLDADEAMDASYGLVAPPEPEPELEPDLELGPEDAGSENVYHEVVKALQVLDDVVYLNHACHHLTELAPAADIKDKIRNLLDRVVTHECSFALRLAPLNALRRDVIAATPETVRYLFPWYEKWNDLPDNGLNLLAMALARQSVSADITPGVLDVLWSEIQHDPPLRDVIVQKAELFAATPVALNQAWALRWILAADEVAAHTRMPNEVTRMDSLTVAIRVVARTILEAGGSAGLDAIRFYAAFCGLKLDREQRYQRLKPVEKALREGRLNSTEAPFQQLQEWQAHAMTDTELARTIFKPWLAKLKAEALLIVHEAAAMEFDPVVYWRLLAAEPSAALDLARKLLPDAVHDAAPETSDGPFSAFPEMLDWINSLIKKGYGNATAFIQEALAASYTARPLRLRPALMQKADRSVDWVAPDAPAIQKVPMPEGRELLTEAETASLRADLDRTVFYYALLALNQDQQWELIQKPKRGRVPITLPQDTSAWQIILLAISGSNKVLKSVFESQSSLAEAPADAPISDEESGIIWRLYVRQDTETESP